VTPGGKDGVPSFSAHFGASPRKDATLAHLAGRVAAVEHGDVKFRSARPVRAGELFALIDTMPKRRQEMQR
jgi:hypothetical protein